MPSGCSGGCTPAGRGGRKRTGCAQPQVRRARRARSLNSNPTAHPHPYLPHISPYLAAGPREAESEAEKQAKQERLLKRKKSVLGAVDIDEDSGFPLGEQLKQVLLKHAGRVMDLFREWDEVIQGDID